MNCLALIPPALFYAQYNGAGAAIAIDHDENHLLAVAGYGTLRSANHLISIHGPFLKVAIIVRWALPRYCTVPAEHGRLPVAVKEQFPYRIS